MSSRYFVAMGIGICCLAIGPQVYGQGFTPVEAESRMQVAEGLQVRLVASEPQVRQPILVKVDDRGRLWTIQYLQYPNPAGLKRTKIDRWSRTVYDRIPKPPPHGPRGADRIAPAAASRCASSARSARTTAGAPARRCAGGNSRQRGPCRGQPGGTCCNAVPHIGLL